MHFELPLTRTEMADYLGLTLETVCRQLSRLRKKEVIALPSGRRVVVRDLKLVRREAQFERCPGTLVKVQSGPLPDPTAATPEFMMRWGCKGMKPAYGPIPWSFPSVAA